MGSKKCVGCGKEFDDSYGFCPYCGRKKGISVEEMKEKKTEKIEDAVKGNIKTYRRGLKDTSEILEILKERDKSTFEIERKLTEKILHRFPEIEKRMKEDQDVEFNAFIINVPYKQKEDYLHHCMLQELAFRNDNIANFTLGVQELASDLYEVHIPIWTNDPLGEIALKKQYENLKSAIPWEQRRFMYVAEPWHYITRIHDFDGRWINWKVIFKINLTEFKEFVEEFRKIPLGVHLFSDLQHAKHFSTVGTALDGESFLGIIEDNETPKFMNKFGILESSFPKNSRPTLELIRISWDLLKDLRFFNFSLNKILSNGPSMFSEHISQDIMETAKDEMAVFTESKILQDKRSKDEILDAIVDEIFSRASRKHQGSLSEILKPVSRNLRSEYRILGDAK